MDVFGESLHVPQINKTFVPVAYSDLTDKNRESVGKITL